MLEGSTILPFEGIDALVEDLKSAKDSPVDVAEDLEARKAGLINAAKARKTAAKCAAKTAEEEERQQIWDRIALEVQNCGVPIDLLRKRRRDISGWTIDSLKAEQMQGNDLAAIPYFVDSMQDAGDMVELEDDLHPSFDILEDTEGPKDQCSGLGQDIHEPTDHNPDAASQHEDNSGVVEAEISRIKVTKPMLKELENNNIKINGPATVIKVIKVTKAEALKPIKSGRPHAGSQQMPKSDAPELGTLPKSSTTAPAKSEELAPEYTSSDELIARKKLVHAALDGNSRSALVNISMLRTPWWLWPPRTMNNRRSERSRSTKRTMWKPRPQRGSRILEMTSYQ